MAQAPAAPTFKILEYTYVEDILEKRGPHREGHLQAARDMEANDKLVLAGAFGQPVSGGLFIFKNCTDDQIRDYVQADPYVQNDLVTGWSIKPYMVAVGGQ